MLNNPTERTVDWAAAEELAFATILADGIPIRLTGEDVERGTFSHRHAVFHDAANGSRFVPLQSFEQARASFEIHNSPLSEAGTVGFEFGYNIQEPSHLVIWEAQYRRLHQRRPGHPRPVRDLGAREVGAASRRSSSCCRTATRGRARSTRAPDPNGFWRRRRASTCAS